MSNNQPVRQAVRTVLVCLTAPVHPRHAALAATSQLALCGITAHGVMPHFTPRHTGGLRGTLRARHLIDLWRDTASGGPVRLLDLAAMRLQAHAQAATQWLIWHQVVTGTRPAQPYWAFAERHRDDPQRYPLTRAQQQYLAQPRVQAMATFNALPNRPCDLPTSALEAFQAGQHTFATLGWLTAVPADGVATTTPSKPGGWLTPASGRLDDQLAYLTDANAYLDRLAPDTTVVAMATTD
jgi:hypothetical protein